MRLLARVLLVLLASTAHAAAPDDYAMSIEQWRAERPASLHKPDGWFSFVGSGIVNVGASTIGSARGNTIVLSRGAARLGSLTLDEDGRASFRVDNSAAREVMIDGGRSAPTSPCKPTRRKRHRPASRSTRPGSTSSPRAI